MRGRRRTARPVSAAMRGRSISPNARRRVEPGSDPRASDGRDRRGRTSAARLGSPAQNRAARPSRRISWPSVTGVASCRCVRPVHHDSRRTPLASPPSVAQLADRAGVSASRHCADHGDVHRGRERVVGRLAALDVVVGMHRRFAPARAAELSSRGWRSPRWRSCWSACPIRSGTRRAGTRRRTRPSITSCAASAMAPPISSGSPPSSTLAKAAAFLNTPNAPHGRAPDVALAADREVLPGCAASARPSSVRRARRRRPSSWFRGGWPCASPLMEDNARPGSAVHDARKRRWSAPSPARRSCASAPPSVASRRCRSSSSARRP